MSFESLPNGSRYPLVGGTGQHCFDRTNFKPHKLPENVQTPTTPAPAQFVGAQAARPAEWSEDRVHVEDCRKSDVRSGAVLGWKGSSVIVLGALQFCLFLKVRFTSCFDITSAYKEFSDELCE